MKFGGTSVGSAAALKQAASIVARSAEECPTVVVVSALSGITDALIQAAEDARSHKRLPEDIMVGLKKRHFNACRELGLAPKDILAPIDALTEVLHGIHYLRELTPRSFDYVLSHGELLSSRIMAAYLNSTGTQAAPMTGWDAGIITNDNHGNAAILDETYDRIPKRIDLNDGTTYVVTGFLGQTVGGERSTLGRGGSDYTAAILGRALGADEIQIWTDVNGILSSDPRVVSNAFTLDELTFQEAAELAFFGANVIHPKTIEPAVKAGIPVRVLNTFESSHPGTQIVAGRRNTERDIVALAVKKQNTILALDSTRMLDAEGYLAKVFHVLHRHQISVDTIATSEVSVCMTVEQRYSDVLQDAARELADIAHVVLRPDRAIVCCVGAGMQEHPGTAAKVFSVVQEAGVNIEMISMGSSRINLTFVVRDEDADPIIRKLHAELIESS
jgi:aspartate kinase